MPKELQELVQALPPSTQNNAREITRSRIRRLMSKNQHKAAKAINAIYGTDYDYKGAMPHDWGPEIASSEY